MLNIQKSSFCAHPLRTTEEESVWIAPRKDGQGMYIAVFNLSDEARRIAVTEAETEISVARAVELWTGNTYAKLYAELGPHACAVWFVGSDDF